MTFRRFIEVLIELGSWEDPALQLHIPGAENQDDSVPVHSIRIARIHDQTGKPIIRLELSSKATDSN